MASVSNANSGETDTDHIENLEELKKLIWGQDLKEEVFQRWIQGFTFSSDEPTALLQFAGGPCAILAPVQTFILKHALFAGQQKSLAGVTAEESQELLTDALTEVLCNASTERLTLVTCKGEEDHEEENGEREDTDERSPKRQKCGHAGFHNIIRCYHCYNAEDIKKKLKKEMKSYNNFGVLLFLYSVLLSKGIQQIKNEMEDYSEPLIDGIHGHGSQSLINLFLTGRATSHVFDGEKDVAGMKFHGILKQPTVGFLTRLEYLRYCEVGSYLKCPLLPIWLLASETHLTVLYSLDMSLVAPESQEIAAKRAFKSFDPEGNGFISTILLGDVLETINLVSVPEYVEIMQKKLDPDELGVIVLTSFMNEFFPQEASSEGHKFELFHYNGIRRSNADEKVKYIMGHAIVDEDVPIQCAEDASPIKTVLQTKWPSIEIQWTNNVTPSLN